MVFYSVFQLAIRIARRVAPLLVVPLFILSGCGWHLQGSSHLPATMLAIRIDTQDAYSDFYRELRTQLLAAGARVETQESDAKAVVTKAVVEIKADQYGQRVASVSARNTPEQYEVFYNIEYAVRYAGAEVIPKERLERTASYSYDSTAVLAKQREQQSMQRALARDLAGLVLRRLALVNVSRVDADGVPAAPGT